MSFKDKLHELIDDISIALILWFVIFFFIMCTGCAPKKECDKPETRWVMDVGGCDSSGYCGVSLYSDDSHSILHAVMRYPTKGAAIVDYVHCYVPYKRPNWMTFK